MVSWSMLIPCLAMTRPCTWRTPPYQNTKLIQTSTRHNSVNMDLIASAVAEYKLKELGEQLSYQSVADKWNVSRSAVSRRH